MTTEQSIEMKDMKKDLHEIKSQMREMYQALIGNTMLNDGGLVGRFNRQEIHLGKLEERLDKAEEKGNKVETFQKIMWSALGAVGMAMFAYILQFIIHK